MDPNFSSTLSVAMKNSSRHIPNKYSQSSLLKAALHFNLGVSLFFGGFTGESVKGESPWNSSCENFSLKIVVTYRFRFGFHIICKIVRILLCTFYHLIAADGVMFWIVFLFVDDDFTRTIGCRTICFCSCDSDLLERLEDARGCRLKDVVPFSSEPIVNGAVTT